jgi:hypothetical protein
VLSLDDPKWRNLSHAHGSAADIPDLLRALASSPEPRDGHEAEPWQSLWSSLCHQGDVFTASYAAIPHVVDIALNRTGPIDFSFFLFPAQVEVARRKQLAPALPADLEAAYHDALSRLIECVNLHRHDAWDQATLLSAAAAQAVAKGHYGVAEALSNLDDDWIEKINAGDAG